MDLLPVDPLFRLPFFTGLLLSLSVPALGPYLRLRSEWLATFAYCQVATGGAVAGALATLPALPLALAAAAVTAAIKGTRRRPGNDLYGVAIIAGWALMIIGMANSVEGHRIGQALIDGQLYFTAEQHFYAAAALAAALAVAMPLLSRALLRQHLFPGQAEANGEPVRLRSGAFDLIVAVAVALAATAMGVMASFALAFLPAWIAFAFAGSWRGAVVWSAALGLAGYLAAFALALALDQPFGPMLAATLIALLPLRLLAPRRQAGA